MGHLQKVKLGRYEANEKTKEAWPLELSNLDSKLPNNM